MKISSVYRKLIEGIEKINLRLAGIPISFFNVSHCWVAFLWYTNESPPQVSASFLQVSVHEQISVQWDVQFPIHGWRQSGTI